MEGDNREKPLESVEGNEKKLKSKIWSEIKKMWVIAGPGILFRFSMSGINVISQAFIGHIGATELAAYALTFTILFCFVLGILMGMGIGFGTLCGQAYGAKQYHKLGIYLQQSWLVLFSVSCILSPLFIFAAPILKVLGQDERIADMAGTVALWFIPVIFSFAVMCSCNMYLQSQSKNFILSCLSLFSLVLDIFLSWLLTVKYKFGFHGALVSVILAYWTPNAGQVMYIIFGGCRETWNGFTTLAFKDLGPAIKLSISSGIMVCLETWYNSLLLVLAGKMENPKVTIDAISICLSISGWAFMISLGFMATVSVRVSNELGKSDAKAAKFSIVMIALTSFAIAFILFISFMLFRENIAYVFTKSQDVAKVVAHLSPFLGFTILLNGVQPVLSGVANGSGQQSIVAYINLGCYYLIGIPLGVLLGFKFKLKVEGLWTGMIIGTSVQTIVLVIMVCRTDWDKQVSLAQKRVNRTILGSKTSDNVDSEAT